MPELSFENTLQVCILVAGIYLVLSLLRTTRGSGLVRALGIALLIFGVGMYSLVRTLELEELEQVLDAIFGVVIIMLVVLFQPELRRGILRLGEHGILRRFLGTDTQETVGEITAAVATMARKKQGALIAIERQTPLDQYIDHGVHLDAAVDKVLLDSIFFDKGALHDGAVIIRGDRIVAGGAILPLSENTNISKSTGTRHRAALGLAEASDAVCVVVSEETGWISVAHDHSMMSRIAGNALEDVLQEKLGNQKTTEKPTTQAKSILTRFFSRALGPKLIALALVLALFLAAHEKVTLTMDFRVQVQNASPGDAVEVPMAELLSIYPPTPTGDGTGELHIVGPDRDTSLMIQVTGSRAVIQELQGGIGGVLELNETTATDRPISADEIRWGAGRLIDNLRVRWKGPAPTLRLETFSRKEITPQQDQVALVRGDLASHLDFAPQSVRFRPNQIKVLGPFARLAEAGEDFSLAFADMEVGASSGGTWSGQVRLTEELEQKGFSLLEALYLEVDLTPLRESLNEIKKDVILLSFDPNQTPAQERYERPDQPVRIRVWVSPLLENASEEDRTSLSIALREYIQTHTRVYVDVDRKRAPGSNKAEVELELRKDSGWYDALPPALQDRIEQRETFPLGVSLHPDDTTLWLNPLPEKDPGTPEPNSSEPNNSPKRD